MNNEENNPVDVFAGTAWEAAVVKSLLENAEIEVFLKDEIRGTMVPWHISPGWYRCRDRCGIICRLRKCQTGGGCR